MVGALSRTETGLEDLRPRLETSTEMACPTVGCCCASRDGDGAKKAGAVYILFMNKGGSVKSSQKMSNVYGNLKTAPGRPVATSLDTQDRFGCALALVGDLDGDGVQEIAACADGDDDGCATSDAGKAGACYILFLHRTGKVRKVQKISNSHGGALQQRHRKFGHERWVRHFRGRRGGLGQRRRSGSSRRCARHRRPERGRVHAALERRRHRQGNFKER